MAEAVIGSSACAYFIMIGASPVDILTILYKSIFGFLNFTTWHLS